LATSQNDDQASSVSVETDVAVVVVVVIELSVVVVVVEVLEWLQQQPSDTDLCSHSSCVAQH
jgi:hypothetical protein